MEKVKKETGFMYDELITDSSTKSTRKKRANVRHRDIVNIIEENKVLVSISKIENLQTMCLLSMGLETGGAIALALLNYGTVFFLLGTFLKFLAS